MKYQSKPYSCGAAAVVNALRCFGKKVPEKRVMALAFTTKDGTDEHGIISALRSLGFDGEAFEVDQIGAARSDLADSQWEPIIICIQNLQHWVTVIGEHEYGFIIVDPARTIKNKKENGVHIVPWKELKNTWLARDGKFYGITVKKK